MSQIEATRDQIEATINALRDRSSDAIDAVLHGVGNVASKVSALTDPPPKRSSRSKFVWVVVTAVVVSVAAYFLTRRSRSDGSATEQWNDRMTDAEAATGTKSPRVVRTA